MNIQRIYLLDKLIDFIWPRNCEVCGRVVDRPRRYICSDCLNRLPLVQVNGCCRQCGRPAEKLDGEFLCEDCRTHHPKFDRVASAFYFENETREMVNAFKFRNHYWLRDDFVDWLEGTVRARFRVDEIEGVLPMPSTLWHRLDRGYNQCVYLTKALAKRINRPYLRGVLWRAGNPKRQGGLNEHDRRTNIKGTFAVHRPQLIRKKTILVVDDILTTGSTLSECAAELKQAGARRVWCVTLARSHRS